MYVFQYVDRFILSFLKLCYMFCTFIVVSFAVKMVNVFRV